MIEISNQVSYVVQFSDILTPCPYHISCLECFILVQLLLVLLLSNFTAFAYVNCSTGNYLYFYWLIIFLSTRRYRYCEVI